MKKTVWANPAELIRETQPENPVMVFAPTALHDRMRRFIAGFPGLVTYAVKSNPEEPVIRNLVQAGLRGFDVASPAEIELVGRLAPNAARHYHNPVRGRSEITAGVKAGVAAWSVDSRSELDKLFEQVPTHVGDLPVEISPRFKLSVWGAAYDFGSKFGAQPELAVELLRDVAARGYQASLTFHPGTQCVDAAAWESYISTAAEIASEAQVKIARLNVGGGFPSHRVSAIEPELETIFDRIEAATRAAFGDDMPQLVCEPGRSLCADAFSLITRVKAVRDGAAIFLNDGVYGGLAELPIVGNIDRIEILTAEGERRTGEPQNRIIFGPTCDSVDRLPGELALPEDISEGDYAIFHGAGAYSTVTNTRFNGFGQLSYATVLSLT